MSRPQDHTEAFFSSSCRGQPEKASACKQRSVSNGGLKVTRERVALFVLGALLAAAFIVICRLSLENMHNKESFQALRAEHEAVIKKLTERSSNASVTAQEACPQPPPEPCLKCQEDWEQYRAQCYYFSSNHSPWDKARDDCRHQGGDLVKVDSREEQSFLVEKLKDKMVEAEDKFWIGLTDSGEEATWLWADGSPLNESLAFWSRGEPDKWMGEDPDGEDCVRMGEKSGCRDLKCWFDKSCRVPHRSICEKSKNVPESSA